MSTSDELTDQVVEEESGGDEAPPARLNLDVKIDPRGACQRHITVTIARDDVERYFNNSFDELMPKAAVPGFRAGRAPRKLVEHRYRKDVKDQVKGNLLMDSLAQLTEEHKLAAISEPDLDPVAVEVPDDGPMTFEFDLEVRPEFDLPQWKGLNVERPVKEFTEKDVDNQLQKMLAQHGSLVPHDGPAEAGDYISTNLTFSNGDDVISRAEEEVIRIRPVLSFRDGKIEKFDKLMAGVKAGETRKAKARLSQDAPNEQLRGKDVTATFDVLEVKKLKMPEITPALLEELGDFKSEAELREAVSNSLNRQLNYHQQQRIREQVLDAMTVAADWDLPPEMLRRQSQRELQRRVLELRRSGFSEAEIRAHQNELRQNSQQATTRMLKEHFILERIAEEETIDAAPSDYDDEIVLIAAQSGESVRRVRAQLEKRGLMDTLRNQIVERKTIETILSHATFKDVPFQLEGMETEAIDQSAGGGDDESEQIPEARYAGEIATPPELEKRD